MPNDYYSGRQLSTKTRPNDASRSEPWTQFACVQGFISVKQPSLTDPSYLSRLCANSHILNSQWPSRIVGCTGYPADSHDTIYLHMNKDLKHHRCPECGSGKYKHKI